MDFKEEITGILEKAGISDVKLEQPGGELGDYAFPCFIEAKERKKSPYETAQELAKEIKLTGAVRKVEVKGPYLNFFVNKKLLNRQVLKGILRRKKPKGRDIIVEHTSINPNASPHVGRARNALIGDSIVRLLRFLGNKVEVHYFVNDIGKQIAMLVLGAGQKRISFDELLDVYVRINKEMDDRPELEKEVFDLLHKLENNDEQIKNRFRKIVEVCVKGQQKIFSELGIEYDCFDYESNYLWDNKTKKILEKLDKTGKLFTDEEGRKVLDQKDFNLPMKSPVLVLTRADGTSLYPLRDIAYHLDKKKKENIVVLGEDQKLYHEQIRAALKLLKHRLPRAVHYSFVLLQDGKMSTRKGNLVLLDEFMKEAVAKSSAEIRKRHDKADRERAKKIAYGAIKYAILKVNPEKNVVFSWQQALNFEGDSGPYLQYAYARISSIIRKSKEKISDEVDYSLLDTNEEAELIKKLGNFTQIAAEAADSLKVNVIANYLFELSTLFSGFYQKCPVLKASDDVRKARLLLIECVRMVLKDGLNILGIEVMEEM